MPRNLPVRIAPLKEGELVEAHRIMALAFGTFLGLPDPMAFMGDRNFLAPRFHASNTKVLAAHSENRLIGSNVVTRWGSFAFFGPLTVLPDYWDQGVAQRLLESTVKILDRWDVRHSGLFTFAHSPKHVGLYQKFGFWPGSLTALMTRTPDSASPETEAGVLLSHLSRAGREQAIRECARLTSQIDDGLDLTAEIRSVLAQHSGDIVLISTRGQVSAFAVCLYGAGTEGGTKTCYIKFAAAQGGSGADRRFSRLLQACDRLAFSLGVSVEAGVNMSRQHAFRLMRAHGFRVTTQGIAMHRPPGAGFNRPAAWVIDDWR